MSSSTAEILLADDGQSGEIRGLTFRSRSLYRILGNVDESQRASVALDALVVGAEVLDRAAHSGDLQNLEQAVSRLDSESKRIVEATTEQVRAAIDKTVAEFAASVQGEEGPMAELFAKFDPSVDGNVVDLLRDLVTSSTMRATAKAVAEISEAAHETMEKLASSVATLDKVAAAEEARLAEAERGTAKGIDHETEVESLLGELVAVGGDSLEDVSTVPGLLGTKKGDKTITPRGGCSIVTEDKCTGRMTESKARALLDEAKANRGADLAMLIVEDESKVPGNQPFHLIDHDKVVVVADRLALRLVYRYFRAKSLEFAKRSGVVDDESAATTLRSLRALLDEIDRALSRFKSLRTEHTKAANAIKKAGEHTDEIADGIAVYVDEMLAEIDEVLGQSMTDAA